MEGWMGMVQGNGAYETLAGKHTGTDRLQTTEKDCWASRFVRCWITTYICPSWFMVVLRYRKLFFGSCLQWVRGWMYMHT